MLGMQIHMFPRASQVWETCVWVHTYVHTCACTYCIQVPAVAAKSLQSCPTLCDPIDGSPPASTIPGILQARTLEWVAISFSSGTGKAKWSLAEVEANMTFHLPLLALLGPA